MRKLLITKLTILTLLFSALSFDNLAKAFVSEPQKEEPAKERPLGVDDNNNIIWDDVERMMEPTYRDKPLLKELIFRLAFAYQRSLEVENQQEAVNWWEHREYAKNCVTKYYQERRPTKRIEYKTDIVVDRLEQIIYAKTERRFGLFMKFSAFLEGVELVEQPCLQL